MSQNENESYGLCGTHERAKLCRVEVIEIQSSTSFLTSDFRLLTPALNRSQSASVAGSSPYQWRSKLAVRGFIVE